MNIYGKEIAFNVVSNMIKKDRLAHSFLLYGEKGTGRKFFAEYMSMMMLCKNAEDDGRPCGQCRICSNIIKGVHADVVSVEHFGKLGGFSVDTVRKICSDAYILPNESEKKIYIFSDADALSVSAQNILLKTVEEPPEYAYFIFTASSKDIFLETIISRVVSIGIEPCSTEECFKALDELEFDRNISEKAVDMLGANIGNCISYIQDEKFRETVELTKQLADCIINRDEYGFLKAVSYAEQDRNILKQVICMLDNIIRDSMIMKFNSDLSSGCYRSGAEKLSDSLALVSGHKIHSLLSESLECIDANVNIKLVTACLCRSIISC